MQGTEQQIQQTGEDAEPTEPSGQSAEHRTTEFAESVFAGLRAREQRLAPLWRMSVNERIAAMRNGQLTLEQCAAWAARCPQEMPLLNGEFEYIAAFTPEVRE